VSSSFRALAVKSLSARTFSISAARESTISAFTLVPCTRARQFLASLVNGGARLRYHGDFGTGGLAIGNIVIGALGAAPWRFDTAAHAAVLAIARAAGRSCRPLAGRVPPARWDADLAPAERSGVEVEEEQVLADLFADLDPGPVGR